MTKENEAPVSPVVSHVTNTLIEGLAKKIVVDWVLKVELKEIVAKSSSKPLTTLSEIIKNTLRETLGGLTVDPISKE